jgi:hypothetical protein
VRPRACLLVSCFTLSDTTAASMGEQACWLVLSDTHGAGLEAYLCRGTGFPGISQCGVAGCIASWSSEFLCVPGNRTYLKCRGMAHRESSRIGDQECRAASPSPILPMVSCFSICGLGRGFAFHWLWDPMGDFWGPPIFLPQGS